MAGTFVRGQGERCVPIVPTTNCHPGIALEQLPTILPAGSTADNGSPVKPGSERGRTRRISIVALARKLLIALSRYVTHGEIPAGAVMKPV
jgi:hypothetical protein